MRRKKNNLPPPPPVLARIDIGYFSPHSLYVKHTLLWSFFFSVFSEGARRTTTRMMMTTTSTGVHGLQSSSIARSSPLYVGARASLSCELPTASNVNNSKNTVNDVIALDDGSFVTCSMDNIVRRWLITATTLKLVGTYIGHVDTIWSVIDTDDSTIITASRDNLIGVWNKTTCDCLDLVEVDSAVCHLFKMKDGSRIACKLLDGTIEIRRRSDLRLLSRYRGELERCCIQLRDGSSKWVLLRSSFHYGTNIERWFEPFLLNTGSMWFKQ